MMIKRGSDIDLLKGINQDLLGEDFEEITERYLEIKHLYQSAAHEVITKLEILDGEFQLIHKRNPIHHTQYRLKTTRSIFEKLKRKGFEVSIESAKENLTDLAGIRVICSYIDDIYTIAKLLVAQDEITVIRKSDYIENPKPNGYRSLHFVVLIPVLFLGKKELVPVEIQIRTIAMDFWASLEHELRYKAEETISSSVVEALQECAETIASTDFKMQDIYHTLEKCDKIV